MRLNSLAQRIMYIVVLFAGLSACSTTKNEDGADLEANEPAEAEPVAPVASEAKPDAGAAVTTPPPSPATPAPESSSVAAGAPQVQAAAAPAVESSAPAGAPINTARHVMYVKTDGAAIRDQPNAKAKIVGTLSKGDHLLVTLDGDWARTDDGTFISAKVLTDKGVGRVRRQAAWGTGGASDEAQVAPRRKSGGKKSTIKKASKKSTGKPSATESSTPAADGGTGEE
jgi:hypothetical protein